MTGLIKWKFILYRNNSPPGFPIKPAGGIKGLGFPEAARARRHGARLALGWVRWKADTLGMPAGARTGRCGAMAPFGDRLKGVTGFRG